MAQFMLLIRGGYEAYANYTPEQAQQAIEKYRAWAGRLRQQGKLLASEKLKDDGGGRLVSIRDGQVAVDGPFAETKETVGGYFIVEAADYAEAIEIAKSCPGLSRNDDTNIEVRQIDNV